MLLNIVFLVAGLAFILAGASKLTDGASAVAKRWGVSDLVVGLTVVAFGTSAPELVISLVAALGGSGELAVGNAVGSNIFNILAIAGITAIVRPIKVTRSILTADIPLVVLSSAAILALGSGPWLGVEGPRVLTRVGGILLLLFFAIFLRYTFAQARAGASDEGASAQGAARKPMAAWKAWVWIVLGLAGLVFGGEWFVRGASGIASAMGVSDAVIGLTIVAAGTSLPELATSIVAAVKGNPGIALGNVIGSNIFNIFLVLGVSSTITPLSFGGVGLVDLLVLAAASLLFWLFGQVIGRRTITRGEGMAMAAGYVAYMVYVVATA